MVLAVPATNTRHVRGGPDGPEGSCELRLRLVTSQGSPYPSRELSSVLQVASKKSFCCCIDLASVFTQVEREIHTLRWSLPQRCRVLSLRPEKKRLSRARRHNNRHSSWPPNAAAATLEGSHVQPLLPRKKRTTPSDGEGPPW